MDTQRKCKVLLHNLSGLMSFPTYLITLKSLSWEGGSKCLANTVCVPLTSLCLTLWCTLAQPAAATTCTPSVTGCFCSYALLYLQEGQAGCARALSSLGAALPMTEGNWCMHISVPSPLDGRTLRCLLHSILGTLGV